MAERRMFSLKIIDSDAFIDMPLSTQALYFHLSMRADDEGFINNSKKIMTMIGASDDDLKVLMAKKFILAFDTGVIVIKHWRIHNYIQKDRFKDTLYVDEKAQISIKNNGVYSLDTNCIQNVSKLETNCIQNVYNLDTQDRIGKDSIDKVSIDKDSINNHIYTQSNKEKELNKKEKESFEQFWEAYPKKVGKGAAEVSFNKLKVSKTLLARMIASINASKETDQWKRQGGQFIPYPATWLNQKRWEDDVSTYTTKLSAEGRVIDDERYKDINF